MSDASDFIIENGVLKKYKGSDADVVIPDGVTRIGYEAFDWRISLKSITLPDSVTSIGSGAFRYCSSLTNIVIPDGLTSIGERAFINCSSLTSITIPDGVTSIGDSLFYWCSSLASITIPDGVTSIGDLAFYWCSSLTSITLPDSVTSIGREAFSGTAIIEDKSRRENGVLYIGNHLIRASSSICGDYVIREGTRSIATGAFSSCSRLTGITIPDGVTTIGNATFSDCSSLTGVTIPASVTQIGKSAFYNCRSLSSLTIPESVTSIGSEAFSGCSSLTSFTLFQATFDALQDLTDGALKSAVLNEHVWKALSPQVQAWFFLSRQGKSLAPVYLAIDDKGAEKLGEAILTELPETASLKECNAIAAFVNMFGVRISDDLLRRLVDTLRSQKNSKRAMAGIEANEEIKSRLSKGSPVSNIGKDTTSDPLVAAMRSSKISAKEAEVKLKEYYSISIKDLPVLRSTEGKDVPAAVLAWLLTIHEEPGKDKWGSPIFGPAWKQPGPSPEAAEVVSMLDGSSLQEALLKLADDFLGMSGRSKKMYLAYPICRYADETTMAELTKRAPKWRSSVSGNSAPPLLTFRHANKYSDTRAAMLFAERYHELKEYAELRGMTEDELRDSYLSDVGLDENGGKVYDLGNQSVTARLQKDLGFLFELPDGKTAKSLPKKNADPAKFEAAKKDFDEMRKAVKKILKSRGQVLFGDFLSGRERKSGEWQAAYCKNPVLRMAAGLLVWKQGRKTFTLTDEGAIDSAGKAYEITDGPIRLAHPMEMKPEKTAAWQRYFNTRGLKQPFAQVWEPVIDPATIQEDRYEGSEQPMYRFAGKDKHGIHSGNLHAYSEDVGFRLDGCELEYEASTWRVQWGAEGETYKLGKFKFKKYTRQVNHIVSLLDAWTVEDRIKKDDVSVMALMDGFTLAQITEFIAEAQEAQAVNVLALLLEYKNTHYADFDPMDEFTLEW